MSAHGMSEAGGLREGRCSGCGTSLREVSGLMTCDHARCPGNLIARGLVTEADLAAAERPPLPTEAPCGGSNCPGASCRDTGPVSATPDAGEASDCACVGYAICTDYGTGTEHDVDRSSCPVHGEMDDAEFADSLDASTSASEPLSEDERVALKACRSAGSLDHALIPDDTFATVAVLLAAREAKARAEAGEQALREAADDLHSQGLPIAAYRLRDRAARIGREVTS